MIPWLSVSWLVSLLRDNWKIKCFYWLVSIQLRNCLIQIGQGREGWNFSQGIFCQEKDFSLLPRAATKKRNLKFWIVNRKNAPHRTIRWKIFSAYLNGSYFIIIIHSECELICIRISTTHLSKCFRIVYCWHPFMKYSGARAEASVIVYLNMLAHCLHKINLNFLDVRDEKSLSCFSTGLLLTPGCYVCKE